jgi:hypothetical protein
MVSKIRKIRFFDKNLISSTIADMNPDRFGTFSPPARHDNSLPKLHQDKRHG